MLVTKEINYEVIREEMSKTSTWNTTNLHTDELDPGDYIIEETVKCMFRGKERYLIKVKDKTYKTSPGFNEIADMKHSLPLKVRAKAGFYKYEKRIIFTIKKQWSPKQ